MTAVLELDGVSKRFGGVDALREVSLTVEEGEIFGLIGPNGAGKTTLVNVVSGQMRSDLGRVVYRGRDLSRAPAHRRARQGIGRTFQNVRLFPDQTVLENVKIGAYLRGTSGAVEAILRLPRMWRDERVIREEAFEALELAGLTGRADALAISLSTGEQRLAELAKAVAMKPGLLFLDEPAAGLNPTEETNLAETIRSLAKHATLVVIEHHLDLIMGLCDRIAVLNYGQLIAVGTPAEVRSSQAVIDAYLGIEATYEAGEPGDPDDA
jgi:branched-chain amino acid transport system ATP-binding protein